MPSSLNISLGTSFPEQLNLSFDTNLASQLKAAGLSGQTNLSSGSSINWGFTATLPAAKIKKKKQQKLD